MKKIIFVLPSLRAVSPIRASLALIKGIHKEYEVLVISIDSKNIENTISKELDELGVEYLYLSENGFKNIIKALSKLNIILEKHKPSFVISYLLRADILVGLSSYKCFKISSMRNMIEHEYMISHGKIVGKLFGLLQLKILKKFSKIIVISNDMKKYFLNKGFSKDKIELIHNFLDESDVNNKLSDSIEFPFKNTFPTIISISSLIKRKNIELLIDVSHELLKEGVRFNVLILGEGPEAEKLKSMIADSSYRENYKFLGHVNNPIPFLSNSTLFVMTSFSEGVSRSLMEALYLGKNCVVSDIDGNRELINEDNGFLFNSKDELKVYIKELILKENTQNTKNLLPEKFTYQNAIYKSKALFEAMKNNN